jgi:hypothetical protein
VASPEGPPRRRWPLVVAAVVLGALATLVVLGWLALETLTPA